MGFWLSWDVEDNVKMQVFVDNAATANTESPSNLKDCSAQVRHGSKRKLEEEEEEETSAAAFQQQQSAAKMELEGRTSGVGGGGGAKSSRVYVIHRQSIFNISMNKLIKSRSFADPSLRRSVLICNTLRTIEREMVSEGLSPSPPLTLLPAMETDKMTLDPLPSSNSNVGVEVYSQPSSLPSASSSSSSSSSSSPSSSSSSTSSSYFVGGANGNVLTAVEPVPCRDNELGYEKSLTDLDSVSGRATPYPSTIHSNNNNIIDVNHNRSVWDSVSSSSSSSTTPTSMMVDRVQTTTISWSSVLSFPSQNELVTSNSSVIDDAWPSNGAFFETETNSGGAGESGGPNTSPSASSDSGISTASDEIFGDIDLSLYDFDLLPLSPPNNRAAPPSAEELLRSFPPHTGQSIQLASPVSSSSNSSSTMMMMMNTTNGSSSSSSSVLPFNAQPRHSRSFDGMSEDFEHGMQVMNAPP